jgi:hypothetical protein
MIYGTAHDDLNGFGRGLASPVALIPAKKLLASTVLKNVLTRRRRPGLGYIAPNPLYGTSSSGFGAPAQPATIDIPLSCGIDQSGNPWIMFNNQYFSSIAAIQAYLSIWGNSGAAPFDTTNPGAAAGYQMLQQVATRQQIVDATTQNVFVTDGTMAGAVGGLKWMGVPFTAYQPITAPTITPPPTPGTPVTTVGPIGPAQYSPVAPDPQTLAAAQINGTLSPSMFNYSQPFNNVVVYFQKFSAANYYMVLNMKFSPLVYWFAWDGTSWNYEPAWTNSNNPVANDTASVWQVIANYNFTPGATTPAPSAAPSLDVPPGFQIMDSPAIVRVYPIYGQAPTIDANGIATIQGTSFYSLVRPGGTLADSIAPSVGLDQTKMSAGLYAYKETDLGPITSAAGRRYELYMLTIYDLYARKIIGPFFETTEGGGGGLLINNPLALASRIIVDVATWGTAEVARAVAKAAGVSQANIDLATEAGAALAIALATAGVAAGISAGSAGAAGAIAPFPVAADAGSATASLILPTTAEVSAEAAAGSTLLPASLSLVAPISADAVSAAVVSGAASAVPATAAPTANVLTQGAAAAGTTLEKAVEGAVISTGATALSTEIKKLTGQLPGVKPPSQVAPSLTINQAGATTAAGGSKLLTWGLGALAALAILKKKAS